MWLYRDIETKIHKQSNPIIDINIDGYKKYSTPRKGESIQKNKKNIIIGCIYKHPSKEVDEFNHLLSQVLDKYSIVDKLM